MYQPSELKLNSKEKLLTSSNELTMEDDNVIVLDKVTKIYKTYKKPSHRITDIFTSKKRHKQYLALDDISLQISKGESIGIIGRNGAGKSTLLKIISGISHPTYGSVQVKGKISSLIELGTGFNNEFTGLQNIYLNASFLGLTREQINNKLDDIIEFAELGSYIDEQLKTYSSGMRARLGFAVAINVDPDILIVDEALSVGDKNFKAKCTTKFFEFKEKKSTTLLIVSHSLESIRNLSDRVMVLNKGKLIYFGEVEQAIKEYQVITRKEEDERYGFFINALGHQVNRKYIIQEEDEPLKNNPIYNPQELHYGTKQVLLDEINLADYTNHVLNPEKIQPDTNFEIKVDIKALKDIKNAEIKVYIIPLEEQESQTNEEKQGDESSQGNWKGDNPTITPDKNEKTFIEESPLIEQQGIIKNMPLLKRGVRYSILLTPIQKMKPGTYYGVYVFIVSKDEEGNPLYLSARENAIRFQVVGTNPHNRETLNKEDDDSPFELTVIENAAVGYKKNLEGKIIQPSLLIQDRDEVLSKNPLYNSNETRYGTQDAVIQNAYLIDYTSNEYNKNINFQDCIDFKLILKTFSDIKNPVFSIILIKEETNEIVYEAHSDDYDFNLDQLDKDKYYSLYISMERVLLNIGQYFATFVLKSRDTKGKDHIIDYRDRTLRFEINKTKNYIDFIGQRCFDFKVSAAKIENLEPMEDEHTIHIQRVYIEDQNMEEDEEYSYNILDAINIQMDLILKGNFEQLMTAVEIKKNCIDENLDAVFYGKQTILDLDKTGGLYCLNYHIINNLNTGNYKIDFQLGFNIDSDTGLLEKKVTQPINFNVHNKKVAFDGVLYQPTAFFMHNALLHSVKINSYKTIVDEKQLILETKIKDHCIHHPLHYFNEVRYGNANALIYDLEWINKTQNTINEKISDIFDDIQLNIMIKSFTEVNNPTLGLIFKNGKKELVYGINNEWQQIPLSPMHKNHYYRITSSFKLLFNTGIYFLSLVLSDNDGKNRVVQIDRREDVLTFKVENQKVRFLGNMHEKIQFEMQEIENDQP